MVGDRLPYTQADVEMMLRASDEINRQQAGIRQFLALLNGSQPEHAEPWNLNLNTSDPVDGFRIELGISYATSLHVVGFVGPMPLILWHVSEGYKPLKPAFVGSVWRSLPTVMNVVADNNPAFRDYINFLRQIDSRT